MKWVAVLVITLLAVSFASAEDFKFFYGVAWGGGACDNVKLAKNLGYNYIMYTDGMERCPDAKNIKFLIESPDRPKMIGYSADLNLTEPKQTAKQIQFFQDYFSWADNDSFPNNMAWGWFGKPDTVVLVPDFQQQRVIDLVINYTLERATRERPQNNFTFAGYAWDVPQLDGDFWSGYQGRDGVGLLGEPGYQEKRPGNGSQVTIKYFTGTDSTYLHDGITHEYSTYQDGKAAYYKQLLAKSKQIYPEVRFIVEPWSPYNTWAKQIQGRTDYAEFTPDLICSEAHSTVPWTLRELSDTRIYSILGIGYEDICSTQPNIFEHEKNVEIMAWLATRGGWQGNYGRWGGTGNMPSYKTVDLPVRFKLLKVVAAWENLNGVALSDRHWNQTSGIYYSNLSYVDNNVIMSVHPRNKMTYLVIINKPVGYYFIDGGGDVYSLDTFMGLSEKLSFTENFTLQPGAYAINGRIDWKSTIGNDTRKNKTINIPPKIKEKEYLLEFQQMRVKFKREVNFTKMRPRDIIVADGMIYVNSSSVLNVPAEITMFNIKQDYYLLRNGILCGSYCDVKFYGVYSGNLIFEVPGFSNYSVGYYNATYTKQDLKLIVEDGIGTFFASIVEWAELIIICIVLFIMATIITRYKR